MENIDTRDRAILAPKHVAELLGCSLSEVYHLRQSGQLREDYRIFGEASKRGLRWKRESIDLFLAIHSSSNADRDEDTPKPFVPVDVKAISAKCKPRVKGMERES